VGDSFGAISIELCHITTVNSNQSVLLFAFYRHELIFLPSYQKDNSSPARNQCVFIKGFRAKRRFSWLKRIRAAAEPLPDDPDNSSEDGIQVSGVLDVPEVGRLYVMK
jgi:hypothetical protein